MYKKICKWRVLGMSKNVVNSAYWLSVDHQMDLVIIVSVAYHMSVDMSFQYNLSVLLHIGQRRRIYFINSKTHSTGKIALPAC